ncbi:MAG: hypothetical protein AAFX04_08500 [Pseudomonadota bacterium]
MDDETQAKQRFAVINILRLGGAVLVVLALLMINGTIGGLPDIVAYVLLVVGLFDFFVVPLLLARRWRSPEEPADRQ